MLDETPLRLAQSLALRAINKAGLTTYPQLAQEIEWHNSTGWHLGAPLREVLEFCRDNNLPALTSIVCNTGSERPTAQGLAYMRGVYGNFDIKKEQQKVFKYPWETVLELNLENTKPSTPGFDHLFATRVYGFEPQEWAMLAFGQEGNRKNALELTGSKPFYVVHFCSNTNTMDQHGNPAIAPSLKGRVLGIAEIQPNPVDPKTHIEAAHRERSIEQWGSDRWPFGLEMTRAWRFTPPPFTRDALPITSKDPWGPTNSIIEITKEERAELAQYDLEEVEVYGQETEWVKLKPRDPSNYTYLMVSESKDALQHSTAPDGMVLVKIGVTSDPARRLLEIRGNHIAVIFGLKFRKVVDNAWLTQTQALEVEAIAHDWAHKNCVHASGEYFYMTKAQFERAAQIVKLGKI